MHSITSGLTRALALTLTPNPNPTVTLTLTLTLTLTSFAFITPGEELPGMVAPLAANSNPNPNSHPNPNPSFNPSPNPNQVAPLAGAFAYLLDTEGDGCNERWKASGGCYFPVAY